MWKLKGGRACHDHSLPMSLQSHSLPLVHALTGLNGPAVEMRTGDGYINATRICKAANKRWGNFFGNGGTKSFLNVLAIKKGCAAVDLVHSDRGGCHTGTWVHPEVATRLAAWCDNRKRRLSTHGYVYAVTSRVLNAVKIGMWTGSLHNLKTRYQTPYGPSLQIWCVAVDDCVQREMQLHKQFKLHNLGVLILFDAGCRTCRSSRKKHATITGTGVRRAF